MFLCFVFLFCCGSDQKNVHIRGTTRFKKCNWDLYNCTAYSVQRYVVQQQQQWAVSSEQ